MSKKAPISKTKLAAEEPKVSVGQKGGTVPPVPGTGVPSVKSLPPAPKLWAQILMVISLFVLLIAGGLALKEQLVEKETIALSTVASQVQQGLVKEIKVSGDKLTISYVGTTTETISRKESESSLMQSFAAYGVATTALSSTTITVGDQTGVRYWIGALAPLLLPIIMLIGLMWFLSRSMKGGGGMQAFSFGQSRARMTNPGDAGQKVTFEDVAGAREAKVELSEIVDFLKNPAKFLAIGATIPKGVLLMGGPGTGKTLLARAVAGEAGVPFFSISGSEFVEMFVGVGASRVRDLFTQAKAVSPAIVFIDEIDAVGRARGSGTGGGNDEREQTLNQILVEMDGFEPNESVIVMAATNRPDVLDSALLRPGRFDRRVTIDAPDRKDRVEILAIHSRKKPLASDADMNVLAERTPGFSGADLMNLMNEAAILAAREDRTEITQYDLLRSVEKVMLGPERRSHILSKKEKEITAYHEAGHAIVASVLPHADPVHKVSIISRGRAAGYTLKLPLEESRMHTKNEFIDDIAVALGGYIVEKLIYGDFTTGASNDIQVLTGMARDMVTRYGMSDKIGPMALEAMRGKTLFGGGIEGGEHSEKVAAEVDAEVKAIIDLAYAKADTVIQTHRAALDAIAMKLVEVETLERDEFEKILIEHNIAPKKKQG
jgi:cell division protease FtsH